MSITYKYNVRKASQKVSVDFFNDILMYSNGWHKNLSQLREVLHVLRDNQVFSKMSKCNFGTSQIEYIGHIIQHGLVSMDASKVEGILTWPQPQFVKEFRGFLRLSGYYKRFIKNYEMLVRPLTALLKKDVECQWGTEAQTTFEQLKQVVCQALVLALPNFEEQFSLDQIFLSDTMNYFIVY